MNVKVDSPTWTYCYKLKFFGTRSFMLGVCVPVERTSDENVLNSPSLGDVKK